MTSRSQLSRRDFVKVGAAGAAGLCLSPRGADALPPSMPERPLGRTGHKVRLFSLGGQATLEQAGTRDASLTIINRAIDLGVNYIDTAAAYGRGISQTYIGEVMATRRDEVFLATKTHDRTRDGSLRLLERSLELLQTDHLDLWQLHNIRTEEQIELIFGDGGAIEALLQARDEGTVRHLGITGHYDPAPLITAVERFDFDTILMALNPADPHFLPFQNELLPLANRKGMGVIAMKIPARGRLFRPDGITSMRDALSYVFSLPVSTAIVGCDTVEQLEENVAIATSFEPLSPAEMSRIEGLTAAYAMEAAFFKKGGAGFGRRGSAD
ncbi:MAG: aldo/keto reductase [Gemmatimonadetes bacterium]|uniref:Aldo/keto reductase n=1 Tax=Candidatus Kutchimonas denitrificans TaxID=3056748 RepID=A0AAE4Z8E8_9BACT|nr:aldo/keto reductase [Gemmatimonadota bacterium]NIR74392.1 aldo/keto reductase [Candidatus Kutchimonas denitrificans]NIS02643.1 aldo/keto reductase [Gemmatimonadota bacterium]NIT68518.1 aldo/keto reductase [Gemmatimonadota bacterium]NIU51995.1 twin-arginine translocation signal domain-containing protein [Gemmatimonadota bacterium]